MLKVNFKSKRIVSINVFQYDYGQKLEISGISLPDEFEMHFQINECEAESRVGEYNSETGIGIVSIPDYCLEQNVRAFPAWLWVEDESSGKTLRTVEFHVTPRKRAIGKPSTADITEVKSYAEQVKDTASSAAEVLEKANSILENELTTDYNDLLHKPRELYTPPDNKNAQDNPFGDASVVYLRDIIKMLYNNDRGTPNGVFDITEDFYLLADENWEESMKSIYVRKGDILAIEYQGSTDGWSYITLFDEQGVYAFTSNMDNWMEQGLLINSSMLFAAIADEDEKIADLTNRIEVLTQAVTNLNEYVNELKSAIISLGGEV